MANAGVERLPGFVRQLGRQTDIYLAVGVIGIIIVMVMPLPAFMLDILLTASITFSIIILMVSIYIIKPLEFSSFPFVLLLCTLFRLALTVASTRLILLHGAQGTDAAGEVIKAFGEFVVGGN